MSTITSCRSCGKELQFVETENGVCSSCQSGQASSDWRSISSSAEVPRDFSSFQKQTDELPGAFSDAVLEHIRSEASFPPPAYPDGSSMPPQGDDSWSLPTAILTWLFSVAALLLFNVIFTVIGVAYMHAHGQDISQQALEKSVNFTIFLLSSIIPTHLVTLAAAWVVVTRAGSRPFFKTLGWKWPPNFQPWQAASFALLMYAIGILIDLFLPAPPNQFNHMTDLVTDRVIGQVLMVVAVTFTAPLVEEVIYRGVLYTPLERKFGVTWAIAIVSLLFAGVHVPQYYPSYSVIAVIMILSIALTSIRAYTKSLLPCVVIHLLFNGIQAVLMVLSKSVNR